METEQQIIEFILQTIGFFILVIMINYNREKSIVGFSNYKQILGFILFLIASILITTTVKI